MNNFIVFDNTGRTGDRYTIVDRETGNVFSAGESKGGVALEGKYCGNCADHRVTLFGAGWRQMPLSRKIIEAETDNYVRNAQLKPDWLGKELPRLEWPVHLLEYIGRLDGVREEGLHSIAAVSFSGSQNDGVRPKTVMAR